MKILVCPRGIFDGGCPRGYVALGYDPLDCGCGATGGQYNRDGDTVTIWGGGTLLGLHNKALVLGLRQPVLSAYDFDVLWPYPEGNGKVTRLAERPSAVAS